MPEPTAGESNAPIIETPVDGMSVSKLIDKGAELLATKIVRMLLAAVIAGGAFGGNTAFQSHRTHVQTWQEMGEHFEDVWKTNNLNQQSFTNLENTVNALSNRLNSILDKIRAQENSRTATNSNL